MRNMSRQDFPLPEDEDPQRLRPAAVSWPVSAAAAPASPPQPPSSAAPAARRAPDYELKLTALEQKIARLREKLDPKIQQLQERYEEERSRLKADFRLRLERIDFDFDRRLDKLGAKIERKLGARFAELNRLRSGRRPDAAVGPPAPLPAAPLALPDPPAPLEAKNDWLDHYDALCKYVEGHDKLPHHLGKHAELGTWCNRQMLLYKRGQLGPDRVDMLHAVQGWCWSPGDVTWFEHYRSLRDSLKNKKLEKVRKINGFDMGKWISRQKSHGRQGQLAENRYRALEKLAGWRWD